MCLPSPHRSDKPRRRSSTLINYNGPFSVTLPKEEPPSAKKSRVHEADVPRDLDPEQGKLASDGDHCSGGHLVEDGSDGAVGDGDRLMSSAGCCESSTLTELCYNESQTEVELVSLIEEQIPRYVLRADTLTDFAGYDNSDWIQTPCLPLDSDLDLTPELIEETFKYFILCAERVGQMTKTYNDIEAVTRLLEEKERDLELAARIGQTLLEKNKEIQTRNEQLEDSLVESNEKVKQLNHDLTLKTSLLQVYTHDEAELESATPVEEPVWNQGLKHLDCLSKKVKVLEEENFSLRQETSQLKVDTTELEEAEDHLVKNVLFQIQDANEQIKMLQEELGDKCEVTLRQQEEIGNLMGKIVMVEGQVKKMALENAELQQHLNAAVDSQRQLTSELSELTDKYHECLALLQETQEDMKDLQKSRRPSVARPQYGMYNPFLPEGSLASELEDSLKKEMDYPMGYSPDERRTHNRRVMDTARAVRRRRKSYGLLSVPGSSPTSGNESCESIAGSSNRSSIYMSDDSFLESEADSSYGSVASALGKPGIPGSNDLETALRRLSMRKANEINEQFLKQEEERKLCKRSLGSFTPTGEHTPESMMSTGSGSNMSEFSRLSGLSFRIPEKLQIVKPIEGSLTLHQWQRLATPHLSGFLDPRPGVQNKGERPLDLEEEEVYDMSDIEEDCPAVPQWPWLCASNGVFIRAR